MKKNSGEENRIHVEVIRRPNQPSRSSRMSHNSNRKNPDANVASLRFFFSDRLISVADVSDFQLVDFYLSPSLCGPVIDGIQCKPNVCSYLVRAKTTAEMSFLINNHQFSLVTLTDDISDSNIDLSCSCSNVNLFSPFLTPNRRF